LVLGTSAATGTIQNDDASVSLAVTSASKSEGNSGSTSYTFTATRTGDTSVAHTAGWAVTGSGSNGASASDFVGGVLPSGTLSFGIREISKTITVQVVGDTQVEADETFTLSLSNPGTGLTLGSSTAMGTIQNDDAALLRGTPVSDTLTGGSGIDVLEGLAGDDRLIGGAGADTLLGGSGIDTARYEGSYLDYRILGSLDGVLSVTPRAAPQDTDNLREIERLQFSDRTLDVDDALAGSDVIYRFYNAERRSHFFTADLLERDFVRQNLPEFMYEGVGFSGLLPGESGGSSVFRFYNTATGTHFYTIAEAERDWVIGNLPSYQYEGVAYQAFASDVEGSSPLYRFYNTEVGVHFYTVNLVERDWVIANLPQYGYEGVAYWVL
jgi:hypothetical protein